MCRFLRMAPSASPDSRAAGIARSPEGLSARRSAGPRGGCGVLCLLHVVCVLYDLHQGTQACMPEGQKGGGGGRGVKGLRESVSVFRCTTSFKIGRDMYNLHAAFLATVLTCYKH
jgi:hypothetical protein